MKQIFTLLSMGMLCLASKSSFAQAINERFENGLAPLSNSCWKLNNISIVTDADKGQKAPIEGTMSAVSNDATSLCEISTPFYNITPTLNASFTYKLSSKLSNLATRTIQIGYTDKNNLFTPLTTVASLTSASNTQKQTYTGTLNITGTYRITIRVSSTNGDGNSFLMMDELNFAPQATSSFNLHYSSSCNTAPIAINDKYVPSIIAPVSGNVLNSPSGVDSDLNSIAPYFETISITGFTQVIETGAGIVTLNATTGDFTFTPAASFSGGPVNFNYTISDNGYDPLTATGTVTITYPYAIVTPLPIHLKSLLGNVNNGKANLTWNVADNETGSYFEIQKSVDGKKFENTAMLFTTAKVGDETYTYSDAATLKEGAFYRLRVVNKDNSVSYSKVIYLKALDATNSNKIMLLQNPVQSTLSFAFTTAVSEPTEIAVYNMAGVKVYSQKTMAQKGTNTINTDCNNKLTTGNYILQVSSASGNATTKIVKY
jgi:hypothetical protein